MTAGAHGKRRANCPPLVDSQHKLGGNAPRISFFKKRSVVMNKSMNKHLLVVSILATALTGCATVQSTEKTEQKISQSIGENIGSFKIVDRAEGNSAPGGFSEGIYTVKTNGGKTYKCSILEPSGFMQAMSFGGAGSAAAMCTDFTKGSKQQGKTNAASCNDLLRAAGKC